MTYWDLMPEYKCERIRSIYLTLLSTFNRTWEAYYFTNLNAMPNQFYEPLYMIQNKYYQLVIHKINIK